MDDRPLPMFRLSDLQPGDVLLWEARQGDPVGASVSLLDGTEWSHAVVVLGWNADRSDVCALSANQAVNGLPSGVNLLPVRTVNQSSDRAMLLLRPSAKVAAAAVDEGRHWVESGALSCAPIGIGSPQLSEFGWEQIALSALVCWTRHVDPGPLRRWVYGLCRQVSAALLDVQPRPYGQPVPGGPVDRWDCCQFVDHLLAGADRPSGTVERDPDVRDDPWRLLGRLYDLWDGEVLDLIRRRLCPPDRSLAATWIDEALAELDALLDQEPGAMGVEAAAGRSLLRELVRLALCAAGRPLGAVDAQDEHGPVPDEPVWPPFSTPRLLRDASSATLQPVGYVDGGGLEP